MNYKLYSHRFSFWALIIFALFIFTSLSLSSLGHIFLIIGLIFYILEIGLNKFLEQLKNETFVSSFGFLGILILVIILSIVVNHNIIEHPFKNLFKIKYFLIPWLSIPQIKSLMREYLTQEKKALLLKLFIISTTIATISGIIGLYTGFNPLKMKNACHPTRACGVYGMYMTYGYGISLFMSLITGLLVHQSQKSSPSRVKLSWIIPSWIINFAGLILSYTRGGLLGFLISSPFFFFKNYKKKFLLGFLSIAIVSGLTLSFSTKMQQTFLERPGSNSQRIAFYKTAWAAFKEKPLFGFGYRNFEPNVKAVKVRHQIEHEYLGGHAHNNFLEHLASTGFLGAIAFGLFVLYWLKEAYQSNTAIGKISFPFIISFLISGMVQYTFGDGENLFLIMTIWMLGVAAEDESIKSFQ